MRADDRPRLSKLQRAGLTRNRLRSDRYTAKWMTIKTNVCPVWGLRQRAAMRAGRTAP
jgi:hypothetical protein